MEIRRRQVRLPVRSTESVRTAAVERLTTSRDSIGSDRRQRLAPVPEAFTQLPSLELGAARSPDEVARTYLERANEGTIAERLLRTMDFLVETLRANVDIPETRAQLQSDGTSYFSMDSGVLNAVREFVTQALPPNEADLDLTAPQVESINAQLRRLMFPEGVQKLESGPPISVGATLLRRTDVANLMARIPDVWPYLNALWTTPEAVRNADRSHLPELATPGFLVPLEQAFPGGVAYHGVGAASRVTTVLRQGFEQRVPGQGLFATNEGNRRISVNWQNGGEAALLTMHLQPWTKVADIRRGTPGAAIYEQFLASLPRRNGAHRQDFAERYGIDVILEDYGMSEYQFIVMNAAAIADANGHPWAT